MPARFYWRDLDNGHITVTAIDRCPPGHVPSDGAPLRDGAAVRTSFHMMDAVPMTTIATFDAAGPSRIADVSTMTDALAAAPASTRDIAFKVEQVMLAADGARAAGRPVQAYASQLRDHARTYGAHGFRASEGARQACERAAQTLMGAADALEAVSHG